MSNTQDNQTIIYTTRLQEAEAHASVGLDILYYASDEEIKKNITLLDVERLAESLIEVVLADRETAIRTVLYNERIGHYTTAHSINVCILAIILSSIAGHTPAEMTELAVTALLHDIGKRFISKELIYKEGPLSYGEMKWVCMHPALGAAYIKRIYPDIPQNIVDGILYHHERNNGRGYPEGLIGEIPYTARLIAVCDIFEAYTAKRPYHEQRSLSDGLDFLSKQEGLDTNLVKSFIAELDCYESIA